MYLLLALLLAFVAFVVWSRSTAPRLVGTQPPPTPTITIEFRSPCSATYPRGSGKTLPTDPSQKEVVDLPCFGRYYATQWFDQEAAAKWEVLTSPTQAQGRRRASGGASKRSHIQHLCVISQSAFWRNVRDGRGYRSTGIFRACWRYEGMLVHTTGRRLAHFVNHRLNPHDDEHDNEHPGECIASFALFSPSTTMCALHTLVCQTSLGTTKHIYAIWKSIRRATLPLLRVLSTVGGLAQYKVGAKMRPSSKVSVSATRSNTRAVRQEEEVLCSCTYGPLVDLHNTK